MASTVQYSAVVTNIEVWGDNCFYATAACVFSHLSVQVLPLDFSTPIHIKSAISFSKCLSLPNMAVVVTNMHWSASRQLLLCNCFEQLLVFSLIWVLKCLLLLSQLAMKKSVSENQLSSENVCLAIFPTFANMYCYLDEAQCSSLAISLSSASH